MSETKGGVRRNMEDRVDDLEERLRAAVEFKSDFGDKGGQCTLSVLLDRMCAWLPPLGSSRIKHRVRGRGPLVREERAAHWLYTFQPAPTYTAARPPLVLGSRAASSALSKREGPTCLVLVPIAAAHPSYSRCLLPPPHRSPSPPIVLLPQT